MKELSSLLNELENNITHYDKQNKRISAASVGWHIEHALLTVSVIIEALEKSNPANYKWKFNFIRTLIYTANKIPRGRAQSPKSVRPKGEILADLLQKNVNVTKAKLESLSRLSRNHHFEHPFFGQLNLKPAIKFLNIHTRHHLKIIHDILQDKQQ